MAKKRDNPKRPTDRKPAVGGNLVWSLVAAGAAHFAAEQRYYDFTVELSILRQQR
jgi:hypothetical protein